MRTILATLVMVMAIISPALSAQKTTIMVRPESEVAAANAILRDIAVVQGSKETADKLNNAIICSTPLPGKSRKLTKDQLMISLRKAGMRDESIDLLCPEQISITRSCSRVSGQALFDTAKEYSVAGKTWNGKVAIESIRLPADQEVPAGKLVLRVKSGSNVRKGQISLPVEIVIDEQVYRTVNVSLKIKIVAPVLVATASISRDEKLSASNVTVQERDITNLPDDILFEDAVTADRTATVPIPEGSILHRNWIAEPLAVRSGDNILVIVESGKIRISDKGTAVQDGRPGQVIKVRLLGDVREVRGTVEEPGIVKISIGRSN